MKREAMRVSFAVFAVLMIAGVILISCQRPTPGAPVLISPQDKSGFTNSPPVFAWHSDEDARAYVLRIAQDSITSPKIILDIKTEDTTYALSEYYFNQLPSGEYCWAVASLSVDKDTIWCDPWIFEIIKAEPDSGKFLITPDDAEVFDIDPPVFVWHSYQTNKGYMLRVARDNFLTGAVLIQDSLADTTLTTPNTVFNKAPNGYYIWSVAPIPDTGLVGWWEFRTFTIDKTLPNAPQLLTPQKDENLSIAPTFVWRKEPLAKYYRIKVCGENLPMPDTIISDTTSDTTYSLSEEAFRICYNGKYLWQVAAVAPGGEIIWSEPQTLYFDKNVPAIDLDTTHFPFGLNYSWVYERSDVGYDGEIYPRDTVTIGVLDSLRFSNGWSFKLDGSFLDVGNPAKIIDNIVQVFGSYKTGIFPSKMQIDHFKIDFFSDSLELSTFFSTGLPYGGHHEISTNVIRLKGTGIVYQEYKNYTCDNLGYPESWVDEVYRLLYFIKGADTVWRSP